MKKNHILKRMAAGLLALALSVTVMDTTAFAKAKAKPGISDSSLTLWTNDWGCLSLERASSKVTWKSSDPKIVKVEKKSGKYSRDAVIVTGNRYGSCTISAKMKHKTYSCKVTVKKGEIIKTYSGKKSKTVLEKVTQKKKSIVVRYKMCTAKKRKCKCPPPSYGLVYRLEKYTDGKWQEIHPNYTISCMPMFKLPYQKSVSRAINLENYFDISKLTKGKYRLYVNVFYQDVKDPYVEFSLK